MEWIKSSYSIGNGNCVEMAWHKASASNYNGSCVEVSYRKASASAGNGSCVEAASGSCGMVHVRDSKNPDGPVLTVGPAAWNAFLLDIKNGELA